MKILTETSNDKFAGSWIREGGNKEINCELQGDELKCIWSDNMVESFRINDINLTGTNNSRTHGWYVEDGRIVWNTGNSWVKKGEKLDIQLLIELDEFINSICVDRLNSLNYFNFL